MSNAAIYFHPDGYDTTGARLMGRHSAGESFLRGFLRHAEVDTLHLWNVARRPLPEMEALVRRIHPTPPPTIWHNSRKRIGAVGVLNLPVPGLAEESWLRRVLGERAYAICGITHTTATERVMRTVGDLLLAPVHDYDALICTSAAVRASVESELDGVRDYLAQDYGPRRRPEPQRVTIPLGVNAEDFATREADRKAWRERLGIPDEGIVVLYVGRFDVRAKMNPALMALALEQAARRTSRPLYWIASGWAADEKLAAALEQNVSALCPSVTYRQIDGRPADVRFSIWSAADIFISFSDNIQETFGLTPVEAMAAGLPCVVTDWDGYRDTVRHGEDGFRIPTYAPPPGHGRDLAFAYADTTLGYDNYVGASGQFTAVDLAAAAQAIVDLAENPELRRRLGAQAQARARSVFDWSAIIPQYQALWAEQDARRRAAPPLLHPPDNPFRPEPFTLFAGYPTRHLRPDWRVAAPAGADWPAAQQLLSSPLASYSAFNRPSLAEAARVFEFLRGRESASAEEVAAQFPPERRGLILRGLLWMARFGVVILTPGPETAGT